MKFSGITSLLLATIASHHITVLALKPDIRVDTNRDGIADISPASEDIEGKASWTPTRGAIFIAGIGHSRPPKLCSAPYAKGFYCNDAMNTPDYAIAPQYLAPIRTVPLAGNISSEVTGKIERLGTGRYYTNIFYKAGNNSDRDWKLIKPETTFSAEQLKRGLELGIHGNNMFRDHRAWDGTVTVRFAVMDPISNITESDVVMLKIAPVLTHHHLQKAVKILTIAGNSTTPDQELFAENIQKEVKAAGIDKPVHLFRGTDEPWAQDFFEPGYTSFPGPNGKPIVLRIMIRSAQPTRASGGQLLNELVGPDVGMFETSDGGRSEINSMGNLETIPPYQHKGKAYPAGRIVIGDWKDQKMAWGVVGFLKAQGVQDPLFVDTDFLRAGHVDELFQFLPDNRSNTSSKGYASWRVAVASPSYGLRLLQKAQAEGHGNTKLVSRDTKFGACIPNDTITSFLSNPSNIGINLRAEKRILANLELIKSETGISPSNIFSLPVLYENDSWNFFRHYNISKFFGNDILFGMPKPVPEGELKVGPVLPCAINGLLLSDKKVVVPKQWGPVIGGKDIFEEAVEREYRNVGIEVGWVDDWTTHHEGGGDVHCGTNSIREGGKWWL